MFLSRFLQVLKGEYRRFLKFSIVGGSGIVVNLAVVWLGNELIFSALKDSLKTSLSYFLGIIISIFTNFVLNDIWTWSDKRQGGIQGFFLRMGKYYVVSAVAGVIQFLISNGLATLSRIYFFKDELQVPVLWKLIFALAGIAVGIMINFFMNHFWTFKK